MWLLLVVLLPCITQQALSCPLTQLELGQGRVVVSLMVRNTRCPTSAGFQEQLVRIMAYFHRGDTLVIFATHTKSLSFYPRDKTVKIATSLKKTLHRLRLMTSQTSKILRIVLVGDADVGKTAICGALKGKAHEHRLISTIGAEFSTTVTGHNVRFELWDTAGQERYRSLVPMYLRQADIYLLVFDISRRSSFESIDDWLDLIREHERPVILVGNKLDLRPSESDSNEDNYSLFQPMSRYVSDAEGFIKAEHHRVPLFHTSATKNTGIEELKTHIETYATPVPESHGSELHDSKMAGFTCCQE